MMLKEFFSRATKAQSIASELMVKMPAQKSKWKGDQLDLDHGLEKVELQINHFS